MRTEDFISVFVCFLLTERANYETGSQSKKKKRTSPWHLISIKFDDLTDLNKNRTQKIAHFKINVMLYLDNQKQIFMLKMGRIVLG